VLCAAAMQNLQQLMLQLLTCDCGNSSDGPNWKERRDMPPITTMQHQHDPLCFAFSAMGFRGNL